MFHETLVQETYVIAACAVCTPVCRLCGRYLAILGRPIRVTVPAVTRPPTALVGSLIRSSNLPHSLQRGVPNILSDDTCMCLFLFNNPEAYPHHGLERICANGLGAGKRYPYNL